MVQCPCAFEEPSGLEEIVRKQSHDTGFFCYIHGDEVDEEVGLRRLKELQATYWKRMVSHGSTPFRYENTQESAKQLLEDAAKKSLESLS